MLGATLPSFGAVFLKKKHVLKRRDGIVLLIIYAGYIAFLVMRIMRT